MSSNTEIETEVQQKKSKIPGFRSGKKWKKVIASIGYVFIVLAIIGSFGNNNDNKSTPIEKKVAASSPVNTPEKNTTSQAAV